MSRVSTVRARARESERAQPKDLDRGGGFPDDHCPSLLFRRISLQGLSAINFAKPRAEPELLTVPTLIVSTGRCQVESPVWK